MFVSYLRQVFSGYSTNKTEILVNPVKNQQKVAFSPDCWTWRFFISTWWRLPFLNTNYKTFAGHIYWY